MEASKAIEIGIKLDISFNNGSVFDLHFETDVEFAEQHDINVDYCNFAFRYDFQTGKLLDWDPKEEWKLAGTRIYREDHVSEMNGIHSLYVPDGATIRDRVYEESTLVFFRHGDDVEEFSTEDHERAEEIHEKLTPQLYYKIAKAVLDQLR